MYILLVIFWLQGGLTLLFQRLLMTEWPEFFCKNYYTYVIVIWSRLQLVDFFNNSPLYIIIIYYSYSLGLIKLIQTPCYCRVELEKWNSRFIKSWTHAHSKGFGYEFTIRIRTKIAAFRRELPCSFPEQDSSSLDEGTDRISNSSSRFDHGVQVERKNGKTKKTANRLEMLH